MGKALEVSYAIYAVLDDMANIVSTNLQATDEATGAEYITSRNLLLGCIGFLSLFSVTVAVLMCRLLPISSLLAPLATHCSTSISRALKFSSAGARIRVIR